MTNDPISAREVAELQSVDNTPTTNSELQDLYNRYTLIWMEELEYSINNLKVYLSDEEAKSLDNAQLDWEQNIVSNHKFDNQLIINNELIYVLGHGFKYSIVQYKMDIYRDRTIHVKYLTF
jgi:hypothetical protein